MTVEHESPNWGKPLLILKWKIHIYIYIYIYIYYSLLISLKILQFYGLRRHPIFSKKSQLIVGFVLKKSIQPLKNWRFAKKNCLFWLKKTSQPPKKKKFCMKKWQKIDKKSSQKEHPAPQKLKFCKKKKFFFYSKRPPNPAKNSNFAWKNDTKLTKK